MVAGPAGRHLAHTFQAPRTTHFSRATARSSIMSGQGFGIAAHKNSFNSNARFF